MNDLVVTEDTGPASAPQAPSAKPGTGSGRSATS